MDLRSLVVGITLLLTACTPQATGTPTPSAPASTSVSSALASAELGPFACSNRSGGIATAFMQLTAVRVAHQTGFDRLTFEFAPWAGAPTGSQAGMPPYQLTQQTSAQFIRDPSGQSVTLAGTAGLRVVVRNTSGAGTYTGGTDLKAGLPAIAETAQLGDFERILSWGVGLNNAACLRVRELGNPVRLAIDVQS